jgi:putative salt-induced outer membrane protein YdiY
MVKSRPNEKWLLWPILLLVFLFAPVLAHGEKFILHLKNGDRLTGQVLSETTNELTFSNPLFGTIKIPKGDVTNRVAIAEPAPAVTNAPPAAASTTNTVTVAASGSATNAPAVKAPKSSSPVKPANLEAEPIATTPRHWQHQIQFGLNLRYSAKDQQEFLVIGKSTYAKEPFRHIFDANFTYGKTEGIESANRLALSEKTEFQLSKRSYIFGLVGGGYDDIRRIEAQFELGPGFGYEVLNLTNQAFVWKTEGGFNFQKEYRADDTDPDSYSLRIAEIFAWRIFEKLTADAKIEFFPNMKDFGEYRLRLENNWRYPLTDRLSLDLVLIDLYDTLAPAEVSRNDLQIRSTLGIKF